LHPHCELRIVAHYFSHQVFDQLLADRDILLACPTVFAIVSRLLHLLHLYRLKNPLVVAEYFAEIAGAYTASKFAVAGISEAPGARFKRNKRDPPRAQPRQKANSVPRRPAVVAASPIRVVFLGHV
jgi:hypothetical protein